LCQQQLVQLHENLEKFKGLDVEMYTISADEPSQQKELFLALEERYGEEVVPFISDPELTLIEKMDMKNNEVAYRGYGLIDQDGTVVFSTINDHWGEQMDDTFEEITKELKAIQAE
jgi:alkyl hydroperoxide reductase subunit AhpC